MNNFTTRHKALYTFSAVLDVHPHPLDQVLDFSELDPKRSRWIAHVITYNQARRFNKVIHDGREYLWIYAFTASGTDWIDDDQQYTYAVEEEREFRKQFHSYKSFPTALLSPAVPDEDFSTRVLEDDNGCEEAYIPLRPDYTERLFAHFTEWSTFFRLMQMFEDIDPWLPADAGCAYLAEVALLMDAPESIVNNADALIALIPDVYLKPHSGIFSYRRDKWPTYEEMLSHYFSVLHLNEYEFCDIQMPDKETK